MNPLFLELTLSFIGAHPWAAFFVGLPLLYVIMYFLTNGFVRIVELLVFRPWNRYLRSCDIALHGWPPPHVDADGDFKPEPKPDETTP